jgi:hypothetical protein
MHVGQRLNDTPCRNVSWDTQICGHLRPRRPEYASWCWRKVIRPKDRGSTKGSKSDEQEARRKASRRLKYTHDNHGTGGISELDEEPTAYSGRQCHCKQRVCALCSCCPVSMARTDPTRDTPHARSVSPDVCVVKRRLSPKQHRPRALCLQCVLLIIARCGYDWMSLVLSLEAPLEHVR